MENDAYHRVVGTLNDRVLCVRGISPLPMFSEKSSRRSGSFWISAPISSNGEFGVMSTTVRYLPNVVHGDLVMVSRRCRMSCVHTHRRVNVPLEMASGRIGLKTSRSAIPTAPAFSAHQERTHADRADSFPN